jgi:hypothetical protein
MKITDRIRDAIGRRLETDDDRALKDEQWEAGMWADGWTKVPDQEADHGPWGDGPNLSAWTYREAVEAGVIEATAEEAEANYQAFGATDPEDEWLDGGAAYSQYIDQNSGDEAGL